MNTIIDWCLKNRILVLIATGVFFLLSLYSAFNLKLDAIPDLSDTQVIVEAKFAGQPPQVIEDQVTYPLTTKMLSIPKAETVRGFSYFGFSLIYILFEDNTDLYWARSRVLEYLNGMQSSLPENVKFTLGPDATALGWVYQYALKDTSGKHTLADLRDLQDFVLRYELAAVEGVAEVAPVGGFRRQFQVQVNPELLYQYNITLQQVENAIKRANVESGARIYEHAEAEYMVLVKGYLKHIEQLKQIPLTSGEESAVLRLGQVAEIIEGPDIRRGIASLNGKGETVGGIIVMRQGEDVMTTIANVKAKLSQLKKSLPAGVEIETVYDRSQLINKATGNLLFKLGEELIIVALITVLFLWHVRSALVALLVLPLGVGLTFLIIQQAGLTANIMSLGGIAIAIGVMVDASIVMVENTHKQLEKLKGTASAVEKLEASRKAIYEVAPALFWSIVIIVISFLPVFALPSQSGKMFTPLALTKTLAMVVSALITITVLPVFASFFVSGKIRHESESRFTMWLQKYYHQILDYSLRNRGRVLVIACIVLLVSLIPITGIPGPDKPLVKPVGSEFMPRLEEGDLLYMPTTIPGISVTKAREILLQTDKLIMKTPEVKKVFGKIGRAETATDPAPLTMIETTILLKDRSEFRDGYTIEDIIQELNENVKLPGLVNAFTMPIKTRIDMLSTGIKTPLGVKVMSNNLDYLQRVSKQLEDRLKMIPGVSSVFADRTSGGNYLIYNIDRERAGFYGLNQADIESVLSSAVGGKKVTDIIDGPYRYSANLRYQRAFRESLTALNNIYIPLPNNRGKIPVSQVAELKIEKGPAMIKTENARPASYIYIDTRQTDIGSLAHKIQTEIDSMIARKEIAWPAGTSYELSGEYKEMQLAKDRMLLLIPLVLAAILIILYLHFKSFADAFIIVISALLFAPLGGLWFMWFAGYERSVASDVGFIALAGLAAETGVLMMVYIKDEMKSLGKKLSEKELREAIFAGAVSRLRPKIMTVLTTMLALAPLFWGNEPGNNAMRRIAAPMFGGLLTSAATTLILVPVLVEFSTLPKKSSNFFRKLNLRR